MYNMEKTTMPGRNHYDIDRMGQNVYDKRQKLVSHQMSEFGRDGNGAEYHLGNGGTTMGFYEDNEKNVQTILERGIGILAQNYTVKKLDAGEFAAPITVGTQFLIAHYEIEGVFIILVFCLL